MLFKEPAAVYLRTIREHTKHFQTIYKNPVRTSQETPHVSATKSSLLMLFGETVAVYCENHAEHTNTLPNKKHSVPASQETHYICATKSSRLMLFGETVAVYCENHTEHTSTQFWQNVEFLYVKRSANCTEMGQKSEWTNE
jgi:hypothetical protein